MSLAFEWEQLGEEIDGWCPNQARYYIAWLAEMIAKVISDGPLRLSFERDQAPCRDTVITVRIRCDEDQAKAIMHEIEDEALALSDGYWCDGCHHRESVQELSVILVGDCKGMVRYDGR